MPRSRTQQRRAGAGQGNLALGDREGLSTEKQEYNPTPIINEIRQHLETWRGLRSPTDWGVTPATQQLLRHWRHHDFEDVRPFFCQVEAVETVIWLTEVAQRDKRRYGSIWEHIKGANEEANPELLRLALKMATGSGKTTVMAMLIAWQTVNAVRSPASNLFSRGFLIITPGITIRDRLRVLLPDDADNYYRTREILPADMLPDIGKAKIVITNYHAFKQRETVELSKVGRALPAGARRADHHGGERRPDAAARLRRAAGAQERGRHQRRGAPLLPREAGQDDEGDLKGEEKDEAKKNNEAARLWISGIEALKRKAGVRAVYDLSATPFFLRGSGYAEGTLFPWTVSDFSLMDAIECGIVKLPRIPVADNAIASEEDMPKFRDLWEHIGGDHAQEGSAASRAISTRSTLPTVAADRALRALRPLHQGAPGVAARWGSRCRRCSSWCATTRPPRSSSTSGSRAGSAVKEDGERAPRALRPPGAVPQLQRARRAPGAAQHAADRQRAARSRARRSTRSSAPWPARRSSSSSARC